MGPFLFCGSDVTRENMIVHWMQWTDTVMGTVHFCCFMNGMGCASGYPRKELDAWKPGKVTWAA